MHRSNEHQKIVTHRDHVEIKPTSISGNGVVTGPALTLFVEGIEIQKPQRVKEQDGASCWAVELRP